jgi:hypothetical protein
MGNLAHTHPRVLFAAGAALLLCLSVAPALVQADDPRLESITPERLVLRGSVGDEAITATLRFESSVALELVFLGSPLIRDGADDTSGEECAADPLCLDPSKVTFEPKSLELEPNLPADVVVSVSGVSRPGTYQGSITVRSRAVLPDTTSAPTTASPAPSMSPEPRVPSEIEIEVVVGAGPHLALVGGAEGVEAKRVRTDWSVDDWVAAVFLSEAERADRVDISLVNTTEDPVSVRPAVSARGSNTAEVLPASAIVSPLPTPTVEAGSVATLGLQLNLDDVEPDEYTGAVYLTTSPEHPPQELPLKLTIRQGPFWPLMFIIGGIGLGFLVKYLLTRGSKVAEAYDRYAAVARGLETADLTDEDRAVLNKRLAGIVAALDRLNDAASDAQVTELSAAIGVLSDLKEFEATADDKYRAEIAGVRTWAHVGQAAEATKALNLLRVKAAMEASQAVVPDDVRQIDLSRVDAGEAVDRVAWPQRARSGVLGWAASIALQLAVIVVVVGGILFFEQSTFHEAPSFDFGPWAIGLGILAAVWVLAGALLREGSPARPHMDAVRAFLRRHRLTAIRGARWPLRLALWVVLGVVGMELLYVNEVSELLGARADPVVHYVFWGLGTDVTSRTLTNFAKG